MGKDTAKLAPRDLALVDEFHIRGRDATVELADRAKPQAGERVLDVGCGLGGSARFLAAERSCVATVLDLTSEYVDAATELARVVGLDAVRFCRGSALDLPFADGEFDLVWTEHAQMNIADKQRLYSEMARVLRPGGRLAFHDVFAGAGQPYYPVPWAEEAAISFLVAPDESRTLLEQAGFRIVHWEDTTKRSLEWFAAAAKRSVGSGPPPLGLHLVMGANARAKVSNLVRNLGEGRLVVVQAVAAKT
jgi:MPBQ/MSBQ methyltransferase